MKTLATLLILVLLPFSMSVNAGVKFETYNVSDLSWDVDTGYLYLKDSVTLSADYLSASHIGDFTMIACPKKHDTLTEYIVGLDTVISLHRIECDTCITSWSYNDSSFVRIDSIPCDTVFRIRYEDVWAPKVQVYLDTLQWQKLLGILEEVKDE